VPRASWTLWLRCLKLRVKCLPCLQLPNAEPQQGTMHLAWGHLAAEGASQASLLPTCLESSLELAS
jgi:hypothetical protein